MSRRKFLQMLGMGAVVWTIDGATPGMVAWAAPPTGPFSVPLLTYDYAALEPYIDATTMRLHHDKHHGAYVSNLNTALAKYPDLQNKSITYLIENLSQLPSEIQTTVRNNGGGHLNHSMYWKIMAPATGQQPAGDLAKAIDRNFGSFAEFQKQFEAAGTKHFGSGWVWLVLQHGKLKIVTTANQDSPLLNGMLPVMGNDLWEHAYYLNYQNKRADYLKAWWQVVNWSEVGRRYDRFLTIKS